MNNIWTYELAEAELSFMEEYSDTDANDTGTFAPWTTIVQNQEVMKIKINHKNCCCFIDHLICAFPQYVKQFYALQ